MRVGLRYLRRHPWQTALMILGVMLGVAVMVAIDLANAAASRAFDLSTDAIAGKATHQIVGGPTGLDEAIYTRLRVEGGVRLAAPVVTDYVSSPQLGDRPIQLLGVDPFAEAPFRSYLLTGNAARATGFGRETSPDAATSAAPLTAFLTRPGALLISEGLARENGLAVGDPVALIVAGRQITGSVAGLLQPADSLSRRALDGLILADIATAQEITGRIGKLDAIDLILPERPCRGARDRAGCCRPARRSSRWRRGSGALSQMTAAFRINLTALSLLALVVGMFLIYNSMTFSVVQRRPLFGTLRCLGVTPVEIGLLVLVEAVAVGVLGSALGLGLGLILGQGAVRLVTQTINDLYFVVTVRGIVIPVESLIKGAVLGTLATVISAALPAWEAAAAPPRLTLVRSGIEHQARRAVPLTVLAGLSGLIAGGALLAITPAALSTALRQLLGPASTAGAAECPDRQLRRHLPRHRRFRAAGSRRHPAADAWRRAGHEQALRRDRPPCAAQHHRRVEPHRGRHRRADGRRLGRHRRRADGGQLPQHRRDLARPDVVGRHLHLGAQPDRDALGCTARSRAA